MEKIYRLRLKAREITRKRGHIFSFRYQREFQMDRGALIKILWGNCILCGAWVRIVDYPKNGKEIRGPAIKFNCKNGAIPAETFRPMKNIFVDDFQKEFFEKMKKKKKTTMSRFKI